MTKTTRVSWADFMAEWDGHPTMDVMVLRRWGSEEALWAAYFTSKMEDDEARHVRRVWFNAERLVQYKLGPQLDRLEAKLDKLLRCIVEPL